MRTASQLAHGHCQGVGCDRPFAWTEADHAADWSAGGETALDNDVPFCDDHHDLEHEDGWTITFHPETGTVTWTSPDGAKHVDVPPPYP